MSQFAFLFTILISQYKISFIFNFTYFFIARKISLHFTTRRNSQIILLRIIRIVTETWNYLTSMFLSFILFYSTFLCLVLLCIFYFLFFIFKQNNRSDTTQFSPQGTPQSIVRICTWRLTFYPPPTSTKQSSGLQFILQNV